MRDGVLVVDQDANPSVSEKCGRRVLIRALTLVENDNDLEASTVGVDQGAQK
jgi:hypothetical protein